MTKPLNSHKNSIAHTSDRETPQAQSQPQSQALDPTDGSDIRVLCVDDHALLIEGLVRQFSIEGRIRVVGQLASADLLIEEVTRLHPDVVILDIELPGPDVFEMANRLRHMHPNTRFIFLSAHVRDGYLEAAYKCGAWGYFAKGDELTDIVDGIMQVVRSVPGTFLMGPKVRQRCKPIQPIASSRSPLAASTDDGPLTTVRSTLSEREIEVLRLIGKGLSRVEIGKQLSRSAKTIDGHQEHIMKKLGIDSRAELMRYAIREGFAEA